MPAPLTGTVIGSFAVGTVLLFQPVPKSITDGVTVVDLVPTNVAVGSGGSFSQVLTATNDPAYTPFNWAYEVVVQQPSGDHLHFFMNLAAGTVVNLATLPSVIGSDMGGSYTFPIYIPINGVADRPINAPAVNSGTDNTAVFNAAIAAISDSVAAYARETGGSNPSFTWARPTLILPPGRYTVGDLAPILFPNLHIKGAGRDSTVIHHIGAGDLFTLGTFTSTPVHPYVGTAQGFTLEDLSIVKVDGLVKADGTRTGAAVVDNFNGDVTLRNLRIYGYKYGFTAWAGSDFTLLEDVEFQWCDVAAYLGPASDQSVIRRMFCLRNRECIILGGSQTQIEDSWFVDSSEHHIVREVNRTPRGGVNPAYLNGAFYSERPITVKGCWFEDDATQTGRFVKAAIKFATDEPPLNPSYYGHNMTIEDSFVVNSRVAAHKRAFISCQMPVDNVIVNRAVGLANMDWWVQREPTETLEVDLIDVQTQPGYTPIPYWGNGTTAESPWVGARSYTSETRRTTLAASDVIAEVGTTDLVGEGDVRAIKNSDGSVTLEEFASGSWRPRIKVDIEARAIVLGPDLAGGGAFVKAGSGTPEGVVTAGIGSVFFRVDGGTGTSFYVKESGAGNTGWVAK